MFAPEIVLKMGSAGLVKLKWPGFTPPRGLIFLRPTDWGTVLGDHVVATAILDRLLHHSHVLTIRGDSYRLREKRRSGLIKTTAAPAQAGASE